MIHVEGLAARPVAPSGRTEPNDVRAFLGIFDSVFQAMRQTTSRMTELAEEKARRKTEDQVGRRAEAAAQQTAERTEPCAPAEDASPARLGRLREQADESARKTEEAGRNDRANTKKVRREQSESNPAVALNPADNSTEENSTTGASPMPLFMNSAPVFYFNMHGMGDFSAGGESVSVTTDGVNPTDVQPVGGVSVVPAGTVSEYTTPLAGITMAGGTSAAQATIPSVAGQGGSEGGLGGGQNSTMAAASKSGDVSARPAGAGADFQGVLEGASRTRSDSNLSGAKSVQTQKQSNAASETIDLNRPGSIRELAHIIRGRAGSRNSSMTLHLDPPELGQVRIDVRMRQQELALRIQANTEAGHEILRSKLGDLRDALERQGIQVKEMDVEWRSPAPASETTHHSENPAHQEGHHDGSAFDRPGGQPDESRHDPRFVFGDGPGDVDHAALSTNEEYDGVTGLAETGVDLIV